VTPTRRFPLIHHLERRQPLGAAPGAVANVCDPNYVMLASIAKAHLGGAEAYGAAHARLRRG
jgi:hypothetical protein